MQKKVSLVFVAPLLLKSFFGRKGASYGRVITVGRSHGITVVFSTSALTFWQRSLDADECSCFCMTTKSFQTTRPFEHCVEWREQVLRPKETVKFPLVVERWEQHWTTERFPGGQSRCAICIVINYKHLHITFCSSKVAQGRRSLFASGSCEQKRTVVFSTGKFADRSCELFYTDFADASCDVSLYFDWIHVHSVCCYCTFTFVERDTEILVADKKKSAK